MRSTPPNLDQKELPQPAVSIAYSIVDAGGVLGPKLPNVPSRGDPCSVVTMEGGGNTAYFGFAKKRAGVEPGFEAVVIDSKFIEAFQNIREKIENDLRFKSAASQARKVAAIVEIEEILGRKAASAKIALMAKENQEKVSHLIKKYPEYFTIWMFKQDYDEVSSWRDRVEIKEAKRAATSRISENLNAYREAIATDVARLFTQNTQDLKLQMSHYQNGKLKIMTRCKIEPRYKDLARVYTLTGDEDLPTEEQTGLFENFLVDESLGGRKSIHCPGMGMNLALCLLMEDRDFLGAYGQNKGMIDGKLFMVDLGKAFNDKARVLDTLQDNGQFTVPLLGRIRLDKVRRHALYRNISVLYDVPFAENMAGFHLINKMLKGSSPSQEIIDSYDAIMGGDGKEFTKMLNRISSRSLEQIFLEHIAYLTKLQKQAPNKAMKDEYGIIINDVKITKDRALRNATRIVQVFEERLLLTADQVELLSNLEKLTSDVYDLSHNGKVQISHLQVHPKSRVKWQLEKKNDDTFYLSFEGDMSNWNSQIKEKLKCLVPEIKSISIIPKVITSPGSPNEMRLTLNKEQLGMFLREITEENVRKLQIPTSDYATTIEIFSKFLDNKKPNIPESRKNDPIAVLEFIIATIKNTSKQEKQQICKVFRVKTIEELYIRLNWLIDENPLIHKKTVRIFRENEHIIRQKALRFFRGNEQIIREVEEIYKNTDDKSFLLYMKSKLSDNQILRLLEVDSEVDPIYKAEEIIDDWIMQNRSQEPRPGLETKGAELSRHRIWSPRRADFSAVGSDSDTDPDPDPKEPDGSADMPAKKPGSLPKV